MEVGVISDFLENSDIVMSQLPRDLRRESAVARMLLFRVRNLPEHFFSIVSVLCYHVEFSTMG
jgi:hypothetical protein